MTNETKSKLKKPVRLFVGILILAMGFLLPTIKIWVEHNGVTQQGGIEVLLPENLQWLKYVTFILLVIGGFALMITAYQKEEVVNGV